MPSARPLTTVTPATARPAAELAGHREPVGATARRVPTMATDSAVEQLDEALERPGEEEDGGRVHELVQAGRIARRRGGRRRRGPRPRRALARAAASNRCRASAHVGSPLRSPTDGLDQLRVGEREQRGRPVARPLEQPGDPRRQQADELAAAQAVLARAFTRRLRARAAPDACQAIAERLVDVREHAAARCPRGRRSCARAAARGRGRGRSASGSGGPAQQRLGAPRRPSGTCRARWRGPIRALQLTAARRKRCLLARARRDHALPHLPSCLGRLPRRPTAASRPRARASRQMRSMRSSSGPLQAAHVARPLDRAAAAARRRSCPHGHPLDAATSMNSAGNTSVRCARVISDRALLERLPQRLEREPRELGQLVEEQHAAVRERDLARPRPAAAADQPRAARSCGAARGTAAACTSRPSPSPATLWIRVISTASLEARAAAGCPAAGGRASSCRRRAGRPSAGCGRRRPRSRARAWRPPARGRRRGRARRGAARASAGCAAPGLPAPVQQVHEPRDRRAPRAPRARPARPPPRSPRARSGACSPAARAPSAMASAPRTGRSAPPSDSSPQTAHAVERLPAAPARCGEHTHREREVEAGPALRTPPGARFAVSRCSGNSSPEFSSAARTRSRDSRTAASGSPTIVKAGRPRRTSTSTVTSRAVDALDGEGGDGCEHAAKLGAAGVTDQRAFVTTSPTAL